MGSTWRPARFSAIAGRGFHLTAGWAEPTSIPALLIEGVAIAVALVPARLPVAARPPIGQPALRRHVFDSPLAMVDSAEDLHPLSVVADTASAAASWYHRECTVVAGGVGNDRFWRHHRAGATHRRWRTGC